MIRHKVLGVLIAIISAGWLFPLGLGVESYLDFWQSEGWPLLLSQQHPTNSFPYIHFAAQCFRWAFLWLAVVVFGWSYATYIAFNRSRAA
jgi:hypothetical protein